METFILLLIGGVIVWRVRVYRWCVLCEKKARSRGSELCPTCQAELEIAIEKLLKRKG